MGRTSVSFERLPEVERVLIIVFIITTVLVNIIFLFRCRRVSEILTKPIHCSRLLLSLGSIILATFSYVNMARGLFLDADDISWMTRLISKLYFHRFFPFAFGCGLLFQALSVMYGTESSIQRFTCISRPYVRLLFVAIVPWCLAFVIVCLIAVSDDDWGASGECFESDSSRIRLTAIEITCVILPVVAAFICSVIMIRKTRQSPLTQPKEIAYPSTAQEPLTPSAPTTVQPAGQATIMLPAQPSYPTQAFAEKYPKPETHNFHFPQYPTQDSPPQHSPQDAPPEYSEQDPSPHYSQLYPQQYPPAHDQRYSQIGSQWYLQANQHQYPLPYTPPPSPHQAPYLHSRPFTPPTPVASEDAESTKKIKMSLLLSCIILAISTLPTSLLASSLSCDDLRDSEKDAPLIFQVFVFWLMFLYPVAIPLVWLRSVAT